MNGITVAFYKQTAPSSGYNLIYAGHCSKNQNYKSMPSSHYTESIHCSQICFAILNE